MRRRKGTFEIRRIELSQGVSYYFYIECYKLEITRSPYTTRNNAKNALVKLSKEFNLDLREIK